MKKDYNVIVITVLLGMLITLNSSSAILYAGQLDNFEKSATKKEDTSNHKDDEKKKETKKPVNDDDSLTGAIFGFMFEGIARLFNDAALLSLARIQGSSDPLCKDIPLRETGSPDLPFIRADLNYQHLQSDIEALDGRLEVGYGPLGLQYRHTYFREHAPADAMHLAYVHGLFRVSGSPILEVDTGLGAVMLHGEDLNSGFSFTVPINIYPVPQLNVRFIPTISTIEGNSICDFDGSVAYVHRYFAVRFGYRTIQVHDETLQGPYAGVSIYY